MSSSRRIKAVLFDLDDTLIDWSKKSVRAGSVSRRHVDNMHHYLTQEGHKLPDCDAFFALFNETLIAAWTEAKKTWSGVNFERVVRATLVAAQLDMSTINTHDVLVAYDWQPVPGIEPYPETLKVLSTLKESGYKLGLITNSMQPMWMRDVELHAYGIMPFFRRPRDIGRYRLYETPSLYLSFCIKADWRCATRGDFCWGSARE